MKERPCYGHTFHLWGTRSPEASGTLFSLVAEVCLSFKAATLGISGPQRSSLPRVPDLSLSRQEGEPELFCLERREKMEERVTGQNPRDS